MAPVSQRRLPSSDARADAGPLAAAFAVTVTVQTGIPILGAILFPVGFCMLYLLGFDPLTGVFVLTPLAWIDRRPA